MFLDTEFDVVFHVFSFVCIFRAHYAFLSLVAKEEDCEGEEYQAKDVDGDP